MGQEPRADVAQARMVLAASIADAYADLARQFSERDSAQVAVKVRTQSAQLFAERFANGLETQAGVKEAESRQQSARADLFELDESIALTRNRIAALDEDVRAQYAFRCAGAGCRHSMLVGQSVLNLFTRLQRESGIAMLFITHDRVTVRAVADVVLSIDQGRAVYVDTASIDAPAADVALLHRTAAIHGAGDDF
ncbi:hypothetical protein [Paraburkholderia hospita]|uniref:hypothetical protein n=1 Tax=Paraburkholderia hospita TaxID=169430 RepID=UPI001F280FB2|nr:hypothetical protein [Paraburkholderia hospita]